MPESKRARQEAIASLRDHRGWQFLCERLDADIKNTFESLLNIDPASVAEIARLQANIEVRRIVKRAVEHAHETLGRS